MLCEPKHAHMRAHTHKPFDLHGNQEGFIFKEKKTVFLLEYYLLTRVSGEQAGNPITCSFSLRYSCALLFKSSFYKSHFAPQKNYLSTCFH